MARQSKLDEYIDKIEAKLVALEAAHEAEVASYTTRRDFLIDMRSEMRASKPKAARVRRPKATLDTAKDAREAIQS